MNNETMPGNVPLSEGLGSSLFDGAELFELKATHGFPLDFALDKIINEEGMAVDWVGFIEAARRNGWWDFQTYEVICHGMVDADLPREMQKQIQLRFQLYVLQHRHPREPNV